MSAHSPILNERPFNHADGERYVILISTDKGLHVVTRTYNNKPVIRVGITAARTFRDMKSVELCIAKGGILNYDHRICQVKDLMEPRYYVQYNLPKKGEPYILYGTAWYDKTQESEDTYTDHAEASAVLDRHKKYLLEYYYSRIMNLKRVIL